jgi:hypothetical protein
VVASGPGQWFQNACGHFTFGDSGIVCSQNMPNRMVTTNLSLTDSVRLRWWLLFGVLVYLGNGFKMHVIIVLLEILA